MFSKLHLTTAQTFVLHSVLSLIVGGIGAAGTTGLQVVFSNGNFDPRLVVGAGGAAFLAWFTHGFVSLKSSPQIQTALQDTAQELKVAPALLPDIEAFARQIAPFLAGELMKIKTPPVSALQGQQAVRQSTLPVQQPQTPGAYQPPVVNPGNVMGGGGYPQQPNQSAVWDLRTGQMQAAPYPGHPG